MPLYSPAQLFFYLVELENNSHSNERTTVAIFFFFLSISRVKKEKNANLGKPRTGQTQPSEDPTQSVSVDINESITRAEMDTIVAEITAIDTRIGNVTDGAQSTGNINQRLNYLDSRVNSANIDNVVTAVDVSGASVLVAPTSQNRYVQAFTGAERTSLPSTPVDTSIHNAQPVSVRHALNDLDVATTNLRQSVLGRPSSAMTVAVIDRGSGYEVGTTYALTSHNGTFVRITASDQTGGILGAIMAESNVNIAVNAMLTVIAPDNGTATQRFKFRPCA